jgi:hypothetical protein
MHGFMAILGASLSFSQGGGQTTQSVLLRRSVRRHGTVSTQRTDRKMAEKFPLSGRNDGSNKNWLEKFALELGETDVVRVSIAMVCGQVKLPDTAAQADRPGSLL